MQPTVDSPLKSAGDDSSLQSTSSLSAMEPGVKLALLRGRHPFGLSSWASAPLAATLDLAREATTFNLFTRRLRAHHRPRVYVAAGVRQTGVHCRAGRFT